jgi:hypothetical protein
MSVVLDFGRNDRLFWPEGLCVGDSLYVQICRQGVGLGGIGADYPLPEPHLETDAAGLRL